MYLIYNQSAHEGPLIHDEPLSAATIRDCSVARSREQIAMLAGLKRHQASLNRSAAAPLCFQREGAGAGVVVASSSSNEAQLSSSSNDRCASTASPPTLRRSQRIQQANDDDDRDARVVAARSLRELYLLSGNCVRLRVNQVLVPTYLLTTPRAPALRGHFLLESCWGVYASFELPLRGHCAALEDSALRVSAEDQWREIRAYNQDILTTAFESDQDDDDDSDADEDGGDIEVEVDDGAADDVLA